MQCRTQLASAGRAASICAAARRGGAAACRGGIASPEARAISASASAGFRAPARLCYCDSRAVRERVLRGRGRAPGVPAHPRKRRAARRPRALAVGANTPSLCHSANN
jgi:hypothetical protein